ncbi:MAG: hypothetical protein EB027_04555 [Actinobacteria bacterium]|nr:hypothetical protein [Actinomycetota bacterium]
MDALKTVFLVLHFAGIAGLAVGVGAALHKKIVQARGAVWHSSLLMLLSGIGLVAVDSMSGDDIDHGKVGVKFLVLLVIAALAFRLNRGAKSATDSGPTGQYFVIGLLTVANILIAASL